MMNGEEWALSQTEAETSFNPQHGYPNLFVKTELCKKFRRGTCGYGAKCNFAHTIQELKRQPKLCRLFHHKRHCHYGRNCRFLHSTPFNNPLPIPNPQPQLQPEYKKMKTSAVAPSDGNSCSEHRIMQPSDAATNASTSSWHKNDKPYAVVKSIFKENDLQKISRIYADWIWDMPCSQTG